MEPDSLAIVQKGLSKVTGLGWCKSGRAEGSCHEVPLGDETGKRGRALREQRASLLPVQDLLHVFLRRTSFSVQRSVAQTGACTAPSHPAQVAVYCDEHGKQLHYDWSHSTMT